MFIAMTSAVSISAQTFMDHLQKKTQGQGTVTVTQSKEINDLVNGNNNQKTLLQTSSKTVSDKISNTEKKKQIVEPQHSTKEHQSQESVNPIKENKETPQTIINKENHQNNNKKADSLDDDFSIPTVDMRKKIMARSHKITGYRVQAFAGGNTRNDRQKAEQIGSNIKMNFPDQPVYVHFYSPRWICRVGNYKSFAEANRMLKAIRKLGYSSASIVKGKITVQY